MACYFLVVYLYKLEKKIAISRYLFNSSTANVTFYRYFIHFSVCDGFCQFFFLQRQPDIFAK